MMEELKQMQVQLIKNEKMSSLGQMVARVAPEINRVINFIYGNLTTAEEYIENILTFSSRTRCINSSLSRRY
ncbi:MAG: hypothetical protein QNJ74_04705 [Trichodesmium sp. MO_231.B1]|nr:hypothetical protein [Trichodesmium sp. MO_231.B1]